MQCAGGSPPVDCGQPGGVLLPRHRRGGRGLLRHVCAFMLVVAPTPVRGAYFYVEEGKTRCFQENILQHQVLKMTYSMQDKEVLKVNDTHGSSSSQCKILMKNPHGEVVQTHSLLHEKHQGVIGHAAQVDGYHSVCMECVAQDWFTFGRRKMKWSITFDVLGEGFDKLLNPGKMASLQNVKDAQNTVEQVMERMSAISMENDYEKNFEIGFVHVSESVNTDVAAFKLLQVLLIAGVTAFQIHNLSRFLRRNRLFECLPMRGKPVL